MASARSGLETTMSGEVPSCPEDTRSPKNPDKEWKH